MKVSKSFYSTAIPHREVPWAYLATFAIPGESAQWVLENGSPKQFRSAMEAELAGFRVMMAKLNKTRDVQGFLTKRHNTIRTFHAPEDKHRVSEPTVESVFGKK